MPLNNRPVRDIAPDDYTYGCRSAIQKSIRRQDLDLCKTAFDELWSVPEQRNWLKWRLPIIVMEDALPMTGEFGEFHYQADKTEADYRKFIYRLCLAPKNHDAAPVAWSPMNAKSLGHLTDHVELQTFAHWNKKIGKRDPSSVAVPLLQSIEEMDVGDYVLAGCSAYAERLPKGGMKNDRFLLVAAMLIAAIRGIDKQAVVDSIKLSADRWKKKTGRKMPKRCDLPWYVFDKHTVAGKIANTIFCRHSLKKYKGLDATKFGHLWWGFESSYIPPSAMQYVDIDDPERALSIFECGWILQTMRRKNCFADHDAKATKKIWDLTMRDDIKGAVEWILRKRYEDNLK